MNQNEKSRFDSVVAAQLGAPAPDPAPDPAPAPAPKEEEKVDTPTDKAVEQASPQTEGDKAASEPVIYKIDFGDGQERDLTPEQISATFKRYSALNHQNAQLGPVMTVVKNMLKENPDASPKQLADGLDAAYKAQQKNPQFGRDAEKGEQNSEDKSNEPSDLETMFSKWEEENAASLPPGYKELMMGGANKNAAIEAELAQTRKLLQAVLAQSKGVADAAQQGVRQGQDAQNQAIQSQIATNIDRVQQHLGLADDKAEDFMVFAAERGYTMEDFADVNMTLRVMTDFRNNMDSPEMERLRAIAQRRQAYTGSLGSTPSSSPSTAPAEAGNSTFDRMTDNALRSRIG